MWCPNCGSKLKDDVKFCPNCGTNVQDDVVQRESDKWCDLEYESEESTDYSGYDDLDIEDEEVKKGSKMPMIIILVILAAGILVGVGAYVLLDGGLKGEQQSSKQTEKIEEGTSAEDNTQTDEENKTEENKDKTGEEIKQTEPEEITGRLISFPSNMNSYGKLNVWKASATSVVDQEGHDNSANMVLDGRDETSWQEGVEGSGIGESLTFQFDRECKVRYVSLKLGNWRSSDYYWKNNRPKTLEISTDKGTAVTATFPDEQKKCWVEFSEDCPVSDIHITIKDVYEGTAAKWDDTCIAGIEFYGVEN